MKKLLWVFLTMGLVTLMVAPSLAGLAVDFASVQHNITVGNGSLGFEFSTNAAIFVTSLGYYDDLKNGLTQDHDVGIYDVAGTLLVSTQVRNADPLAGFFHFRAITPFLLARGQTYFIQGVTGAENYTWATNGFVVDPSINFIADAYFNPEGGILAFPNGSNGLTAAQGGGWFGPNFDATPVPVPTTLLLLASGLLGLGGWRRPRKS